MNGLFHHASAMPIAYKRSGKARLVHISRIPSGNFAVAGGVLRFWYSTKYMIQIVTSLISVRPFTHGHCATMALADFSQFVFSPLDENTSWETTRPPRVTRLFQISRKTAILKKQSASPMRARLYLSHIQTCIPCKYWTLAILAASSYMTASYAISVRQASVLPAASFRFHLTMDTCQS